MRKIIALVTILGFIATANLGLAATKMGSHEGAMVSGNVVAIERGHKNSLLSLREPNGQLFRVSSTNDKLKGIHTGDRVVVKDAKGWAVSIKEIGKGTAKSPTSLTHKHG